MKRMQGWMWLLELWASEGEPEPAAKSLLAHPERQAGVQAFNSANANPLPLP